MLPPVSPETQRLGPYRIDERIAVGGMAEVFKAHEDVVVGEPRTVVVKRMLPSLMTEQVAREMFAEEARLGALVSHTNVTRVLGSGDERGHPYLVLEYVRGCDLWRLTRWLTREGNVLGTELAVFIACEMLAGLHAVHEARDERGRELGIVHLDVSPSNVLLSVYGDVKLSDFGIARARREHMRPASSMGERAKGKIGYLSPEQVGGEPVDRRADVFSAAVVTAELLIGRPLFQGGSELAVLLAIRDGRIEPLLDAMHSLPDGLVDVVVEALATTTSARTADADTFRTRLLPYTSTETAPLRRELGELVASARTNTGEIGEPTPTVDSPIDGADLLSDMKPVGPVSNSGPKTAEMLPATYRVTTSTGAHVGTFTYAKIVEAISIGTIGVSDAVAVAGAPPQALYTMPELSRHLPPSSLTPTTKDTKAPQPPDETYAISTGGFVRAMTEILLRRDTGLVLCEQGGVRKEVYVQDGTPVFVTSNLAGELLGEYLVARGAISRGELDMALAVMPRYEGRLGDTLVGLALVEPVHLFQHIATQVREKLLDVYTWTSGQVTIYRGVPAPSSGFPLGATAWQLVDEGIRRRVAQGLESALFDAHLADSVTHATPLPPLLISEPIPPWLTRVLTLTRHPIDVQALVETLEEPGSRDPGRGYRYLALLFHLGALRWVT